MGRIIGIAGPAGSGKDTVAKMFVELKPDARIVALADPMKRFCLEVFGWEPERLWGPSERRAEPDADGLTARVALQRLGTEWGRALRQDVWIDYLLRTSLAAWGDTVVTDIRFPNEAEKIRSAGGVVVFVTGRASAGVPAHESESHWTNPEFLKHVTFRIDNSGTIDDLRQSVLDLAKWAE